MTCSSTLDKSTHARLDLFRLPGKNTKEFLFICFYSNTKIFLYQNTLPAPKKVVLPVDLKISQFRSHPFFNHKKGFRNKIRCHRNLQRNPFQKADTPKLLNKPLKRRTTVAKCSSPYTLSKHPLEPKRLINVSPFGNRCQRKRRKRVVRYQ